MFYSLLGGLRRSRRSRGAGVARNTRSTPTLDTLERRELLAIDFTSAVGLGAPSLELVNIAGTPQGNMATAGNFSGRVQSPDGALTTSNLVGIGGSNVLIANYQADGSLLWAREVTAFVPNSVSVTRVAADPTDGSVVIAGVFQGTVDFDPGPGIALTINRNVSRQLDPFLVKLNALGEFQWVRTFEGVGANQGASVSALAVTRFGEVAVAGLMTGTYDFDPSGGSVSLNTGQPNLALPYLAKLNRNGDFVNDGVSSFAGLLGSAVNASIRVNAIESDSSGRIVATGGFVGTADFGPNSNTFMLNSAGGQDAFVLQVDRRGTLNWANRLGGQPSTGNNSPEQGLAIGTDAAGNVYVAAQYHSLQVTYGAPSSGVPLNLRFTGPNDQLVTRLSPTGRFTWATRLGTGLDLGSTLGVSPSGIVGVSGVVPDLQSFDASIRAAATFSPRPGVNPSLYVLALSTSTGRASGLVLGGGVVRNTSVGAAAVGARGIAAAGRYSLNASGGPSGQSGFYGNRLVPSIIGLEMSSLVSVSLVGAAPQPQPTPGGGGGTGGGTDTGTGGLPLQVTQFTSTQRHGLLRAISLRLNGFANPSSVVDPRSILVVTSGRDRVYGTADDRSVRLKTSYDSRNRLITIRPVSAHRLNHPLRLIVSGAWPFGVRGVDGEFLDGDGNGIAGGDFVRDLTI